MLVRELAGGEDPDPRRAGQPRLRVRARGRGRSGSWPRRGVQRARRRRGRGPRRRLRGGQGVRRRLRPPHPRALGRGRDQGLRARGGGRGAEAGVARLARLRTPAARRRAPLLAHRGHRGGRAARDLPLPRARAASRSRSTATRSRSRSTATPTAARPRAAPARGIPVYNVALPAAAARRSPSSCRVPYRRDPGPGPGRRRRARPPRRRDDLQ